MTGPSTATPSRFEHVPVTVYPTSAEGSRAVAREIAAFIRAPRPGNRPAVLGLATGSTPLSLYAELVRMHREEALSFANVITFNLDEYYPMQPEDPRSYRHFIRAPRPGNRPAVLGLATGSTPLSLYAELVRMHREEALTSSA